MALKNIQYDAIMREYDRKQLLSRRRAQERTEEIYQRLPRIEEIQKEMASLSARKVRALLRGESDNVRDLKEEIAGLSAEKEALLAAYGYPADYMEQRYECPACKDTGYVGQKKCSCFQNETIRLLYQQSNIQEILKKENFTTFSFEWYSDTIKDGAGKTPLAYARFAYHKAQEFAENFKVRGGNLFIYGDTGVGKTFLSNCIAEELLRQGVRVLYFSAYELFALLADQTFSRENPDGELTRDSVNAAELLIIDDLGTEFTNSFVKTQLFAMINDRLMHKKSTLISTNYDLETFSNVYTTRVFSRIVQNYTILTLTGEDIRLQKR